MRHKMSTINFENKLINVERLQTICDMEKFQFQENIKPLKIPIANKYINALNEGRILNKEQETTYQYLLDRIQQSLVTERKIGLIQINQQLGIGSIALENLEKYESMLYTGCVRIAQDDTLPVGCTRDLTYEYRCSEENSPLYIVVDGRKIGSIARFTEHAPMLEDLSSYKFAKNIEQRVATANFAFDQYWALRYNAIYVVIVQYALRPINKGELLCVDYGQAYWNCAGIKPDLLDKYTYQPIDRSLWRAEDIEPVENSLRFFDTVDSQQKISKKNIVMHEILMDPEVDALEKISRRKKIKI